MNLNVIMKNINSVVIDDLEHIKTQISSEQSKFKDSTILMTGCGGFLGFYLINFFVYYASELKIKKIIGLDISKGMLDVGIEKIKDRNLNNTIEMVVGDSENLKYENDFFDAVTVSFGVRNFESLDSGLSEIFRVLKPNGSLVILETSNPTKFPFKQFYRFYSKFILPSIGKIFSKDKVAYNYLSESSAEFPYGEKFNNILKKIGFNNVVDFPQTFGVATIYLASKS